MHKMKAFAIMLIALTMLPVTACSGSGGGTTSADPPKAEEKVEAKTEALDAKDQEKDKPEEQAKKELLAFDMGGEPVKFMTWGGPPEEGKTNQEDVRYKRMKEIEKKYNTKIEWVTVPWGEGASKIAAAGLSGEPAADFLILDLYLAYPSLAQQGYLRPVDDLINLDDTKWPKKIKEFSSFGGKIYGLVENVGAGAGLYYNRTLLKREGLEAPHELIKKGEWTWDKYLEMAKKATKDLNGDGAIDQWGIVSYAPVHARQLVYSNNGNIVEDKDGKLNFGLGDPNSMEALRFLYDLHNTHKVVMPNKNGNFEDYNETRKCSIPARHCS
ncbi:extracellular solute-binding protein [Paenibacillus profundus]|uniref:Extracellular solute-binding protein n=1 Tax=Paenibacillus profundus TaxID=1173085 RepID=A0ABS8YI69_9BACL|nr:extracellular solute-binding protein [Paenibacillus profundus]MCE5171466.1 extracellular solute-binding protein [Paenibacillus profundus]